jgi:uncharacterized protein
MIEYRTVDSINAFRRDAWNALFPGEIERFEYLQAIERSGLAGFEWRYVIAEEDGRLIAAAPAFITDYRLDTTLEGSGKRFIGALRRLAPGALTLRLACIGSPCTDTLLLGIARTLDPARRDTVLAGLLRAFESEAHDCGCRLLGLKDIPAQHAQFWNRIARRAGFSPLPGLPVASLEINWSSLEEYLAHLSPGTRRDMRRKLRSRAWVRVERRHNIDDVMNRVLALYADTRARAGMQFEELTAAYFRGVLELTPGASCALYYVGGELLAANLLIQDGRTLLDKYFCMNAGAGRDHNLYFLSWFANVEYCIANGLKRYQSGQAGYANKLRLGSVLQGTSMYFRHCNALVNGVLRAAAPLFTASLGAQPSA